MESNISTDSSLQNEALESLIRSYQESMDHVYKAKEYEKGFIIEWQKEEDRKKILKEQEELTNAILGIKQTLKNQIQSKHPRSLEFKEILGILENPIHSTNESLPLYQALGMSNENLLALLEFGKELLDQHSNEKAIELFTIVTFLDYKNFDAWIGLALSYLFDKKFDESISIAWKAHLLNPKNKVPVECLLCCYEHQERWEKAAQILDNFRAIKDELNSPTRKLLGRHSKYISKFLKYKGGNK